MRKWEATNELKITSPKVDLNERIKAYKGGLKPREIFKKFYKGEEIQKVLNCGVKLLMGMEALDRKQSSFDQPVFGAIQGRNLRRFEKWLRRGRCQTHHLES